MDKLTEKINGDVQLVKCKNKICAAICIAYGACEKCPINEALRKLADYEERDKKRMLLNLPVPEGTEVYCVIYNRWRIAGTVKSMVFSIKAYAEIDFRKEWNKTVFPTYGEAWKRLEEMVRNGRKNL